MERITRHPLSGALWAAIVVSVAVTIIAGVTVGYGDVVPESVGGRLIAAFVMVAGLGFLAVTTAAITSAFLDAARQRRPAEGENPLVAEMRELQRQVETLTADVRAGR